MSANDSIYDLKFTNNKGEEVNLADYKGKPLLIVNTASKCGFTPHYEGLQKLHEEYKDKGLVVLGFPCDQFAHQEPGNDEAIDEFCKVNFGVSFPLSTKVEVNGSKSDPIFKFLKKHSSGLMGSGIKWNFTKFLVSPDGQTVKRFAPATKPDALQSDIEKLLKK
jgi:glutathione peroxidase